MLLLKALWSYTGSKLQKSYSLPHARIRVKRNNIGKSLCHLLPSDKKILYIPFKQCAEFQNFYLIPTVGAKKVMDM